MATDKYLELTEKHLTGNEQVDIHHQEIANLINRMYAIFKNRGEMSELLSVFNELLGRVRSHFEDEEHFMEQIGVSDLEEHKQIHKKFVADAVEIRDKLKSGEVGISMETFKFLQSFTSEILNVDMKSFGKGKKTEGFVEELKNGVANLNDQVMVLDTLSRDLANAGTNFAQNADSIAAEVNELSEYAKALVEINDLVGEVAAQTNLLGLNAAIEAARAGELGRGFGVVADEIRRLSQTVKDSSKQVSDKVEEITRKIGNIQHSVQKSMEASEEQAAQLEELSATVSHVKNTTANLASLG